MDMLCICLKNAREENGSAMCAHCRWLGLGISLSEEPNFG